LVPNGRVVVVVVEVVGMVHGATIGSPDGSVVVVVVVLVVVGRINAGTGAPLAGKIPMIVDRVSRPTTARAACGMIVNPTRAARPSLTNRPPARRHASVTARIRNIPKMMLIEMSTRSRSGLVAIFNIPVGSVVITPQTAITTAESVDTKSIHPKPLAPVSSWPAPGTTDDANPAFSGELWC
jgi:hypothetical protein